MDHKTSVISQAALNASETTPPKIVRNLRQKIRLAVTAVETTQQTIVVVPTISTQ